MSEDAKGYIVLIFLFIAFTLFMSLFRSGSSSGGYSSYDDDSQFWNTYDSQMMVK